MAKYSPILVWRRLPSELTSPVKWSPCAEGPTFYSISQGLHLAHIKARILIWIYSVLTDKENRINIVRILSVDAVLSPSLRNAWGFLSGLPLLLHFSKERLDIMQRTVSLCDAIMGFVTSSIHSHDKTNEHTLSYRCANNVIERCQNNYRK